MSFFSGPHVKVLLAQRSEKLRAAWRLLFPTSVLAGGLPPRPPLTLRMETLLPGAAEQSALRAAARRGRPVDVELPRDVFLEKTVSIPRAARAQAQAAIAVQMRQEMPAQGRGLVWREALPERRGDRLHFPVLLMKQDELAALRRAVEETGAPLRLVRAAAMPGMAPFLDRRGVTDRAQRRWTALLVLLLAMVAGWTLFERWSALSELESRNAALAQEVAALMDQAVEAQQEAVSREASLSTLAAEIASFEAEYHRLPILTDLTALLEDRVWLSALSLDRDEMRLTGFAEMEVTAVVEAIRSAPWAAEVALDGPVILDPVSRQNRFQLRVTLRAEEAT